MSPRQHTKRMQEVQALFLADPDLAELFSDNPDALEQAAEIALATAKLKGALDPLLKVSTVAMMCDCQPSTISRMCREGLLTEVKFGGARRIPCSAVRRYAERNISEAR